eukprot:7291087-Heterocapsa_arctica.AAC.1
MKKVVAEGKVWAGELGHGSDQQKRKLHNKCDDMFQFRAEGRHHRFQQQLPGEGAAGEERCL